MNLASFFISLPYLPKLILFQFISYLTYRKRYSGKFNEYLCYFINNNDANLISECTTVALTKEVKLL